MKILPTDKLQLLARLASEPSAGRKHFAVMIFILDWFHSRYGDALASVSFIAKKLKERDPYGRGIYRSKVGEALADLITWGYLIRTPGSGQGRAASRLVPNMSFVPANKDANTTFEGETKVVPHNVFVPDCVDAIVPAGVDATAVIIPASVDKDPSTSTRLETGTMVVGINDSPPSLPPALSRAADTGEGFERLWIAYGVSKNRVKARAVFERISPNPDLQEIMITAAIEWRTAWRVGKRERKHLETWLTEERYLEEPPTVRAPTVKAAPIAHTQQPVLPQRKAKVPENFVVADACHGTNDQGDRFIQVNALEVDTGTPIEHIFILDSHDEGRQTEGKLKYGKFVSATGLRDFSDSYDGFVSAAIGRRFIKCGDQYLPANDNENTADREAA